MEHAAAAMTKVGYTTHFPKLRRVATTQRHLSASALTIDVSFALYLLAMSSMSLGTRWIRFNH